MKDDMWKEGRGRRRMKDIDEDDWGGRG